MGRGTASGPVPVVLLCFLLCSTPVHCAGIAPPEFPPLGVQHGAPSPLVLHLATHTVRSGQFEAVTFYLRFANTGREYLRIPLDSLPWAGMDSRLEWQARPAGDANRKSFVWGASVEGPALVLAPGDSVVLQMQDKYLPVGRQSVSVSYVAELVAPPNGGRAAGVVSNSVEVLIERRDLDDAQRRELASELGQVLATAESCSLTGDPYLQGMVRKRMMLTSPYSVPVLVGQMERSPSPGVRHLCASILGDIANRSKCEEFGYERDVSAAGALVGRIREEQEQEAVAGLIQAVFWFGDALSPEQCTALESSLGTRLGDPSEEVRFWAALGLVRLFPASAGQVTERLTVTGFLAEARAAVLRRAMTRAAGHE